MLAVRLKALVDIIHINLFRVIKLPIATTSRTKISLLPDSYKCNLRLVRSQHGGLVVTQAGWVLRVSVPDELTVVHGYLFKQMTVYVDAVHLHARSAV